ncbi:hypothetical protein QBL02_04345 [Leucobacter sp. UT-8R-CII-1-4]|uniref:hypothetical protein n=1 Tax=Leucobacter sp. UT-8R-CII-1-4 TaxID=3040075 RepID=UPI0024A926F0|nr:hypothetical protein [Leucobacter sp. UT-8R-CII-1-4]MDI6022768.1 hypothetical protein [Leucobacter sp. UT-8R-CII-1-4]
MTDQFPSEETPETAAGQQPSPATASKKKVWIFAGIGAVVVVALLIWVLVTQVFAGDTNEVTPPKPVTTTKPTKPTTEPEKPAAPIVLPSCEALNPDGYAAGLEVTKRYAEQGMTDVTTGETDFSKFTLRFGPAAQAALDETIQSQACIYPIHSEAFSLNYTSELPSAAQQTLIAALSADGDYVESTVNGAAVYTWHNPEFDGAYTSTFTVHVFLGDVWFASSGPAVEDLTTAPALAAIRAANPTLP